MTYSVAVVLVAFILQAAHSTPKSVTCSVSVNKHLLKPTPLLLLQNWSTKDITAFILPQDGSNAITFQSGQKIDIVCPGGQVIVDKENMETDLVEATCNSGIEFSVQGLNAPINKIKCTKEVSYTARYTGEKCNNNASSEIEIGIDVQHRFIRHIACCFDHSSQSVVYTWSYIGEAIAGFQVGYPSPDDYFIGPFYNVKPDNIDQLYTRDQQRKTINEILGLPQSDPTIIQPENSYFLGKGHYVAKDDFVYGPQQRLTFSYVNVAPQWQTLKNGNWKTIQNDIRSFAMKRKKFLNVFTGSYGVATLPDVNKKEKDLYLWVNRKGKKGIPVPAIFYRVVYDQSKKAGIVLIVVNNPYKTNINEFVICKDVCATVRVNWLTWKRDDQELGFGYCCDVNEFREVVDILPPFEVKRLLK